MFGASFSTSTSALNNVVNILLNESVKIVILMHEKKNQIIGKKVQWLLTHIPMVSLLLLHRIVLPVTFSFANGQAVTIYLNLNFGNFKNSISRLYLNVYKFSDAQNLVILYNDEISTYKI